MTFEFCIVDGYDLYFNKPHGPIQKCLFYDGAWRNVCLSCGRVEINGEWKSARHLS